MSIPEKDAAVISNISGYEKNLNNKENEIDLNNKLQGDSRLLSAGANSLHMMQRDYSNKKF